jgi:hypothetical protein
MPEPMFMKIGMYIMSPHPNSMANSYIPIIGNTNITASQIAEAKP